MGLEGSGTGLRPSLRKRDQIRNWPTPTCYEELDAFCFLTPFLRRFIPGRADLDAVMQEFGVARKNQAKVPFIWTPEKEEAFQIVKEAIVQNAMAPADPTLQYHLAVDASKRGLGGALFQLHDIDAHTEATNSQEHREAERIIHFISFRLESAETRYTNPEREALAVMKGLAEVKWLIVASPYPTIVYTDHQALKTLLTGPANDSHGRIANWQQRLSEYDIVLVHRRANTHFMGIADGMSRLPSCLMGKAFAEDAIGLDAKIDWTEGGQGFEGNSQMGEGEKGTRHGVLGVRSARRVEGRNEREDGENGNVILEEGASVLRWARWKKFLLSGFFRKVMLFKLGGIAELVKPEVDVGRNEARRVVRMADKFVLAETGGGGKNTGSLFFKERDGSLAGCVVEEEVGDILRSVHDAHGHFAHGVTSGRLYGQYYWPTRNADVSNWIASCDSCQRVKPIRKSGDIRPILQLQPIDMCGIDYIGPIAPTCEVTNARYILIVVDYFSRFLFAQALQDATMQSTMDKLLNHVTPIVGWPRSIYSDNSSHFTGKEVQEMFSKFGVTHFSAAISHPSAVGLAERYIKILTGRIRLRCIDNKTPNFWGLLVREAVIDINTRCIRVHGYTPAEILLGYNPKRTHVKIPGGDIQSWLKEGITSDDVLNSTANEIQRYIDRRDENGLLASEQLAGQHHRQEKAVREPGGAYQRPKAGDLVLLRDLARDKHLGRKLDPRWTEPRLVDRLSKNGMSAYIRALYEPPDRSKRYHIDDLRVYTSRDTNTPPAAAHASIITYERDAFGDRTGEFGQGQRVFDFTDVGW